MDRDEDTLSFASLVQPNTSGKTHSSAGCPRHLSAGPSFKFRHAYTPPPSTPADLLFINAMIVPQNNPSPTDSNGSNSHCRSPRQGNGRRSADSAPKRVSFHESQLTPKRSTSTQLPERRNWVILGDMLQLKSKREAEKNKGFLGSIILACRECRAVEPSTKRVGHVVN